MKAGDLVRLSRVKIAVGCYGIDRMVSADYPGELVKEKGCLSRFQGAVIEMPWNINHQQAQSVSFGCPMRR